MSYGMECIDSHTTHVYPGDGFLMIEEFREFWVGGGYGVQETADNWFNACDSFIPDGAVDRTLEWSAVFVQLNNGKQATRPLIH